MYTVGIFAPDSWNNCNLLALSTSASCRMWAMQGAGPWNLL